MYIIAYHVSNQKQVDEYIKQYAMIDIEEYKGNNGKKIIKEIDMMQASNKNILGKSSANYISKLKKEFIKNMKKIEDNNNWLRNYAAALLRRCIR
jgi:hypothetical protein